jgi:hypothetical protein
LHPFIFIHISAPLLFRNRKMEKGSKIILVLE